jgi:Bacterial Ig-like domain (group 3)
MNSRLPALALLMVLLSLSHAYGQASVASYFETINQAPTTLSLNSSAPVAGLQGPLTLSAVVSYPQSGRIAGNVTFTAESGGTVVATGTVPVGLSGVAAWSPSLPSGEFSIYAVYSGDSNLLGSTSLAISQTVLGMPDFSLSASSISVFQGQSGSTPIKVTATNGFQGTITFSCASPSSSIECAMSPNGLTVPAPSGQTITSVPGGSIALSVTTFATTVEHAGLAGALVLGLFSIKRRRKQLALLGALMLILLLTSCGDGTRYVQHDGTPKGTYSITVTGTSGTLRHMQTVLLTVR